MLCIVFLRYELCLSSARTPTLVLFANLKLAEISLLKLVIFASQVIVIFFEGIFRMFIYALIAANIVSIVVCHYIAKSRGAKPVFWGIMGAIFGPLAIPFALFAKPINQA